ncbi:hypothetical protein D3C87_1687240 [compost metagenome]
MARATSSTAQARIVIPSSNCNNTVIDPLIHVNAATPTPTPTKLAIMAGRISDQFTCGLVRANVTAAFTSDSTLTTLATSATEANWNTPDRPKSTSPNAKPVMVWA